MTSKTQAAVCEVYEISGRKQISASLEVCNVRTGLRMFYGLIHIQRMKMRQIRKTNTRFIEIKEYNTGMRLLLCDTEPAFWSRASTPVCNLHPLKVQATETALLSPHQRWFDVRHWAFELTLNSTRSQSLFVVQNAYNVKTPLVFISHELIFWIRRKGLPDFTQSVLVKHTYY